MSGFFSTRSSGAADGKPRRAAAAPAPVLAAALVALLAGPGAHAQSAAPPPAVTVAPVAVEDVAPVYTFIGHVTAIHSVKIVPRVTAFIDSVPVRQGSEVKAGQVLFQLQKAQYQAAVQAAQAKLLSAQAGLRQAQLAYQRAAQLSARGFEAQANLDQATATRDQAQASVLSAQADLTQAQLDLGYCTITSPIAGRIGAVTLTKGNLVTPSTPALATVNQLDPIRVVFSVSYRVIVGVEQKTGASSGQIASTLTVRLKLPDGSLYKPTGKIAFQNNQVDTATGTVSVYADFPNPNRLLLPGAYVTVEVHRAKPQEQPLVPAAALQTEQGGSFVLVVGPDDRVEQRRVTLGPQIAQSFIVEKGLSGGERVIVAGVQKVKPGETVNPVPAPALSAEGGAPDGSAPADPGR
ncbi:MAG TPA: efflux RND transporter periplasmic adaptor subunit [Stellaceae bacterium]|nr:efflux RND transporter periplasmic adaptor subunit [Stellaceae bacterium]